MELKQELSYAVSEPVVRTDHFKKLLARMGNGANLGCQVQTGPADGSEVRFPVADN